MPMQAYPVLLNELWRFGYGSTGAIRYQGADGVEVELPIPSDADTVDYHLVVDPVTKVPKWDIHTGGPAGGDLTGTYPNPSIAPGAVSTTKLGGDITAAGKALLDDADAAAQRTTLGLGTASTLDSDDDTTLGSGSSVKLPTQNAVKAAIAAAIAGLAWKAPVRATTTANVNLAAGGIANGTTHDGVVVATGDRLLVPAQTAPAENGIYIVPASGAATRATDADSAAELLNASVFIEEGTSYADTQWKVTTNAPITLGTTAITWVQHGGATTYTADESTLHLSGTQFQVKAGGIDTTQLANTAVTPGTYGDGSNAVQLTVDSKGRITGITTVAISGGGGGTVELFDDTAKSADYTILTGDKGKTFVCTNTIALTLPSATDKFWCGVINAGTGMVTVGSLVRLLPGEWCRVGSTASGFYLLDARLDVPIGHPDRPPVSGTAYDAEFNVDPSGWAWFNQNDGSYSVANGKLKILGRSTTNQDVGRAITVPSGSWEFTAKLSLILSFGGSDCWAGIAVLPDLTTGTVKQYGPGRDGWNGCGVRRENLSSFAYSSSNNYESGGLTHGYFRVVWDSSSSNLQYWYSTDGESYHIREISGPGFTPGKIGIGVRAGNVNNGVYCHWFRRTA